VFAIFGLGPAEIICLLFTMALVASVVVIAVVLSTRRTSGVTGEGPDDPLERMKRDYHLLTDAERRELLEFIQDDLRRAPASGPAPPEGFTT
jgi:hypothetical protein